MAIQILEGTAEELTPILASKPKTKYRLIEITSENEKPTSNVFDEASNFKNKQAIELLNSWLAEGMSADEVSKALAEKDLAEFKIGFNANRQSLGEDPVYK